MGSILNESTVLVTGGHGFLGGHLVKKLLKVVPKKQLLIPTSHQYDFRLLADCQEAVKGVDIVIHLAANVGGIGYNQQFPGELFYDNAVMGLHLMEAARLAKVKKFVSIGTVCSYPKFTPSPFVEENFWNGYPEETNAPYGLAKKMSLVQGMAYHAQYGFQSIYLIPVNLYGPGDQFHPQYSHVIPALIRKFCEAKRKGSKHVMVWGSGNATREFLYVEDCAVGIVKATERYSGIEPVNLGSHFEISILALAEKIASIVRYTGKILFDTSKPDGQPQRKLDVSKAKEYFQFQSSTSFDTGLRKTIQWYQKTQ